MQFHVFIVYIFLNTIIPVQNKCMSRCVYKANTSKNTYKLFEPNCQFVVLCDAKLQIERKCIVLLSSELFKDSSQSPSNKHCRFHYAEHRGMWGHIMAWLSHQGNETLYRWHENHLILKNRVKMRSKEKQVLDKSRPVSNSRHVTWLNP